MSGTSILEAFIAGDDFDVERDMGNINITDPLVKAWLTIKTSLTQADPGVLQKIITPNAVAGQGQITQDGSELQGNGIATLVFQVTAAESAVLGTSIRYFWDVQAKSNAGKIYTLTHSDGRAVGRLQLQRGATDATS